MKKSIAVILKCILTTALFILFISLTGLLFSPHKQMETNGNEVYRGLISMAIIQSLVLILLARRSGLNRIGTGWLLSAVFFVINHLLNVIESLVFMHNIYPVRDQLTGIGSGLIMSLAIGFTTSWLFTEKEQEGEPFLRFDWSARLTVPWAGWTLLWFAIYITAGMLIPFSVPGVRDYYFGAYGAMDLSLVPVGYLLQIPRAAIWIIMTIFLVKYLKGGILEKSLIIALTYGTLMSSPLLVNNPYMPSFVRMAHLPEIMFANLIWGYLISHGVAGHFQKKTAK